MAKEKIETLAVLDYLTLLPNRSGLYSFYSGLSIQEYVTAMFLDIDNLSASMIPMDIRWEMNF